MIKREDDISDKFYDSEKKTMSLEKGYGKSSARYLNSASKPKYQRAFSSHSLIGDENIPDFAKKNHFFLNED